MFSSLLSTMLGVMVPLAVPVTAGALLGRYQRLDTKPLLTLYLYFLSPAMLLDTLTRASIKPGDIYVTVAFTLLNLVLMRLLALGLSRALRLGPADTAGLTLISTLTNSVNYGLPVVLLAFGQAGMDKASVYVVGQMILANTVGVYFAARSNFSARGAVRSVFSLPAIYAAALALLLRLTGLHLPADLAKGVSLAAGAYSPVVLCVLGAQMMKVAMTPPVPAARPAFYTGMGVRMLAAPLLAAGLLFLLPADHLLLKVLFILASMPVAVNAVVLAERFGASPAYVSRCILWSTLLSFLWLPLLIAACSS
ncbi:AEC family transporter [Paenibacillus glufosinatiresistens]|uniref:AEC family transporter n=1 Tax=Paenibacillus glufosinatiresistens TaxID=3070657 RepID=UPI00286E6751|nr:AEC family transporter [Paenibacillus sp. YX.27]